MTRKSINGLQLTKSALQAGYVSYTSILTDDQRVTCLRPDSEDVVEMQLQVFISSSKPFVFAFLVAPGDICLKYLVAVPRTQCSTGYHACVYIECQLVENVEWKEELTLCKYQCPTASQVIVKRSISQPQDGLSFGICEIAAFAFLEENDAV